MPRLLAALVFVAGCATPGAGRHLFTLPQKVVCEGARLTPCGMELMGCKGERSTWKCVQRAEYHGPWNAAPYPPDYAPDND